MKHERSCFTINFDDFSPPFSPKLQRPLSCKGFTRPNSGTTRVLPSLNNTTTAGDFSLSFLTTKNSNIKYQIENEKLYEETMQLKSTISNLRKELFEIKKENKQKDYQIQIKDKEINDLIESNHETEENEAEDYTSLILKIKRQNKLLKNEIEEIKGKNQELKKNIKITKTSEYALENEIYQIQFGKLSALIQNAKQIKENHTKKFEELSLLQQNINKQNIIIKELTKKSQEINHNESSLLNEIKLLNTKLSNDNIKIIKNKEKITNLQKENSTLNNDNVVHSKYPMEEVYLNQISTLKKEVNEYKMKIQRTNKILTTLKTRNDKQREFMKNNKKQTQKNSSDYQIIETKPGNDPTPSEEKIKQLKKKLVVSKEIETQLETQMKQYQEKIKELTANINSEEQIEFGIDADNPYYSADDNNDPISTNKLTSSQFNQFTYILFKNFEAKKITLDIAKEKIIDDFMNEYNKESHSSMNENFDKIVENLTDKIFALTRNKNNYNTKILTIFISALLYNSEGSVTKLLDYFNVLFSYTREYSVEDEEKMKQRLSTKYKDLISKLMLGIKDNNPNNNEYISLITVKNVIDSNGINLKDKYIEFLFYFMKNFDDKETKWEDLCIKNLSELLVNTGSQSISESMTEITNEEYIKTIKEAINLMIIGLTKEKKTIRQIFAPFIKSKVSKEKDKETSTDVITIDEFNEELKKININLTDLQLSCLCTKYCINNEFNYLNVGALEQDIKNSSNTSLNGFGNADLIEAENLTNSEQRKVNMTQ